MYQRLFPLSFVFRGSCPVPGRVFPSYDDYYVILHYYYIHFLLRPPYNLLVPEVYEQTLGLVVPNVNDYLVLQQVNKAIILGAVTVVQLGKLNAKKRDEPVSYSHII